MSIPVALTDLPGAVGGFRFAYLLTVSDDGRPHAVAVTPAVVDGALVTETGRRTAANAAARPAVSLVYPPVEDGGYSLIVDADAAAEGTTVTLRPTSAVLHRPAPAGTPVAPGSCGADCVPVPLTGDA